MMNALFGFDPPFRSAKVLAHARGQKCTLRFEGICCGDTETTVSCHIRDRHKGMGTKASDHSSVHGCFTCHAYLDQGTAYSDLGGEVYYQILLRALLETYEVLIQDDIIKFPHDRPRKK